MTFSPAETKIPAAIGNIVVRLKDAVATDEAGPYKSASFDIVVEYSDGSYVHRRGDLIPHLSPAQIAALQSFMDDLRAKAEGELLPP